MRAATATPTEDKEGHMHVIMTGDQGAELHALVMESLREMSHEIAATDNSQYRARLLARRQSLQAAATSLSVSLGDDAEAGRVEPSNGAERPRTWTVEVIFTEDEDRTRADARMCAPQHEWHGWGRARRNPSDP